MKKDLLAISDLTPKDIDNILKRSAALKKMRRQGKAHPTLKGKTLGMIFEKSSTRTRVSFEVGMYQLGGQALFLSSARPPDRPRRTRRRYGAHPLPVP